MKSAMMKAAIIREFNRPISIEDIPVPAVGPRDVLVRVRAAGMCGSDLHILEGKVTTVSLPYTPGHEFAGEVTEVGPEVTRFSVGDRVVNAIDVLCGHCRFCRTGRGNLCVNLKRLGFEINGGDAEYALVPEANLVKIPDSIPFEQASIIPDAVACMLHAVKVQGRVKLGDRVIILGVGGLGMQGIQIAKIAGACVFATSRNNEKLRISKELGADVVLNPKEQDIEKEVMRLTDGEGCDVVFDNIGIDESMRLAIRVCRKGGRIVVVGWAGVAFSIPFQDICMGEKEIVGTRASNRQDLVEAVGLVAAGKTTPYVSDRFPLSEINTALHRLAAGEIYGRGVLVP